MKSKELFILSLGVFVTIVSWMLLDIYHIRLRISQQISIKPAEVRDYQMDKSIIETLKTKK